MNGGNVTDKLKKNTEKNISIQEKDEGKRFTTSSDVLKFIKKKY